MRGEPPTACKRPFSLGCVAHTDGAVFQMGQLHTYGPQSYPEDMRPVMWTIAMSGGYANWYLSTTAWVRRNQRRF